MYRRKIDDHNSYISTTSDNSSEKPRVDSPAKRKITDFFDLKSIKKQKSDLTINPTNRETPALSTVEQEQSEKAVDNENLENDLVDDPEIDPEADCENAPLIWEETIQKWVNDLSGKNFLEDQPFIDFILNLEPQNDINIFNMDLFCSINEHLGLNRSKRYENWEAKEIAKEEIRIQSKYGYCLYEECQSSSCKRNRLKPGFPIRLDEIILRNFKPSHKNHLITPYLKPLGTPSKRLFCDIQKNAEII